MPRGRPVDDETRARIATLCAEGLTRNAIARAVGVAGSTVSLVAADLGHTFDRTEIRAALEARQVDLAAERQRLAEAAIAQAWQALDDMNAPAVMVHFEAGNEHRRGEFREHILDRPTVSDLRNLATVFGIMTTKVAELTRPLSGHVADGALSVLEQVGDSLADAARRLAAEGVDPTAEPDPNTTADEVAGEQPDA